MVFRVLWYVSFDAWVFFRHGVDVDPLFTLFLLPGDINK